VTDADEGELAALLGLAHGVREPEVRVADHAEHVGETPRHERLHDDVGDRALRLGIGWQRGVDTVVADLDAEAGRGVGEARRWLARHGRVVVAVPRASQPTVLDRALAEWAALVRAGVVETAVGAVVMGDGEGPAADGDGGDAALRQLVEPEDAVPCVPIVHGVVHGVVHGRRPP
jgi:hypothetical protein